MIGKIHALRRGDRITNHDSRGSGYGAFKMNQGNRVARTLASIEEFSELVGIVAARRIHDAIQLWEKVVGGSSIM